MGCYRMRGCNRFLKPVTGRGFNTLLEAIVKHYFNCDPKKFFSAEDRDHGPWALMYDKHGVPDE
jgi:hypothetical protein